MKVEVGMKFGRLTVVEKTTIKRKKHKKDEYYNRSASLCLCDCGKTITVEDSNLRTDNSKSCGCLKLENWAKRITKHGMYKTKLYGVWMSMHDRCYLKTSKSYPRYGGKGIKICEKWHTFEGFFEDMGATYQENLSIERIDTKGNYCPENCRWANKFEQANNKSDNLLWPYEGKLLTSIEFAKILNIKPKSLYSARYRKKYGAVKRYEDNEQQ